MHPVLLFRKGPALALLLLVLLLVLRLLVLHCPLVARRQKSSEVLKCWAKLSQLLLLLLLRLYFHTLVMLSRHVMRLLLVLIVIRS